MKNWEYKIVHNSHTVGDLSNSLPENILESLNRQGEEGWELIRIIHIGENMFAYYFKRPK